MTGVRTWAGVALAGALLAAAGATGCGDDDGRDRAGAPPPPASPEQFPRAAGRSLGEIRKQVGAEGPVISTTVSELHPGRNRFGFGLFDRARTQIAEAPTAVYVAPVGGGPARGPFLARYESLAVKPQFQSHTVASDPDAAKSLYVASVELPKAGDYELIGVTRLDDRLVVATPAGGALSVVEDRPSPDVGDAAPRAHSETVADAAGDVSQVDTRQPPSTMHDVDFADVRGRKPVIMLLATPALCQSRVCGPVADLAEQVKAERGDEAAFIHQEIFRDNEVDKGFRPEFAAWRVETEPWLFAIDRHGRIAARIEGAFSAGELEDAVDAALRK